MRTFKRWFGAGAIVVVALALVACPGMLPKITGEIPDQQFAAGAGADDARTFQLDTYFSIDRDAKYTVSSSDEKVAIASESGGVLTVTPVGPGTTNVKVTGSKGGNDPVSQSFSVTVAREEEPEPSPPRSIAEIPDMQFVAGATEAKTVQLDVYFEGATSYTISGGTPVATVSESDGVLTVTPAGPGTANVMVRATNADGSVSQSFSVTVAKEEEPEPSPPRSIAEIPDMQFVAGATEAKTVQLDVYFEGATSYTPSGGTPVATVSESDGVLTVTPAGPGTANVMVRATNDDGSVSQSFSVTVLRDDPDNNQPKRTRPIPPVTGLKFGGSTTVDLQDYYTDDDDAWEDLSFTATSGNTEVVTASVDDEGVITIDVVYHGTATINVTISDGKHNNPVEDSFDVTVDNQAPEPTDEGLDSINVQEGKTQTFSLEGYFDDPEGARLTYDPSSSDETIADASVSGSMITITAVKAGTATITVTASDDGEMSGSRELTVVVTEKPVAPNLPPTATDIEVDDLDLGSNRTASVTLSKYFTDPEGADLTFTSDSNDDKIATVTDPDDASMITITAERRVGTATITVTASDGTNDAVELTFTVTVDADPTNQSPTSERIPNQPLTVDGTGTVTLSDYFRDGDGDDLTYEVESKNTAVATVSDADDDSAITITAVSVGTAMITVTAYDDRSKGVKEAFTVTVEAAPPAINGPPTVKDGVSKYVPPLVVGKSWTADLDNYFTDPEGDTLTYGAPSSDPETVATVSASDTDASMITITAVSAGTATVTVTADDGMSNDGVANADATLTLNVTVEAAPPPANNPPTRTDKAAPTVTLVLEDTPTKTVDVSDGYFSDADAADTLTYTVSEGNDKAGASISGSTVTITAKAAGSATITVTASDGNGGSATMDIMVTVDPPSNMQPVVSSALPDRRIQIQSSSNADTLEIDLSDHFRDPDGVLLFYKVDAVETPTTADQSVIALFATKGTDTGSDDGVGVAPDGKTAGANTVAIVPENPGTATVTVTATDVGNKTATDSFVVTVVAAGTNTGPSSQGSALPSLSGNASASANKRLKIGESRTIVDDATVITHFTDTEVRTVGSGDTLTLSVKYFAAGTSAADAVNPDTKELAADKVGVTSSLSGTTIWNGADGAKFTLTVTGIRGTANSDSDSSSHGHVVALIATDTYGMSVAKVFTVLVNNPPKAEGAQASPATPKTLGTEKGHEDLGFHENPVAANNAQDNEYVTLVEASGGYFSDPDNGDTLECRITGSTGKDYAAFALRSAGDNANMQSDDPVSSTTLRIDPKKTNMANNAAASVTISCVDSFGIHSPSDTLNVKVTHQSASRH